MILYERIRELRIEQGMTQDDLAHAMGYKDRSMITKIESGKVDISQKKVDKFAKVLNTSPAYLMGWVDDKRTTRERIAQAFYGDDGQAKMNLGLFGEDDTPKTEEARILSRGIDRLSPEERAQALAVVKAMFAQHPEIFKD